MTIRRLARPDKGVSTPAAWRKLVGEGNRLRRSVLKAGGPEGHHGTASKGSFAVHSLVYLVGLIVIVLVVLSLLGLA